MAKKLKSIDAFHEAWMTDLEPHVPEPIRTVALFNPPGAVASSAAGIAGRSTGGLIGGLLARKATAPSGPAIPAVLAGALTDTALYLFEVEPSADHAHLEVLRHFDSWAREGLRLDVARKVMSERLTFSLADGRQIDLDGMFVGRVKDRPYQQLVDLVTA